ncbi:hypothetical protein BpHYR1_041009 [Brachionus plicatilis]|uniref:Uncharacterized protein n=1 Tax=Brachionus plicatilis TaxID=10195 RepID=A0A3M7QWN2_BRAPC|nr:hypothetical protein BpHYR1_041009 [Brachionus plicatilis]
MKSTFWKNLLRQSEVKRFLKKRAPHDECLAISCFAIYMHIMKAVLMKEKDKNLVENLYHVTLSLKELIE